MLYIQRKSRRTTVRLGKKHVHSHGDSCGLTESKVLRRTPAGEHSCSMFSRRFRVKLTFTHLFWQKALNHVQSQERACCSSRTWPQLLRACASELRPSYAPHPCSSWAHTIVSIAPLHAAFRDSLVVASPVPGPMVHQADTDANLRGLPFGAVRRRQW